MATEVTISVAKNFSRFPAGRRKDDGPYSGEAFRELLAPLLKEDEIVNVELDGALGYGSSFLEEAFGGLVRAGFAAGDLLRKIRLLSKDATLVREIQGYIKRAA